MFTMISTACYAVGAAMAMVLMARQTNRRLLSDPPEDVDIEKVAKYKFSPTTIVLALGILALSSWCGFAVSSFPQVTIYAVIKIGICCTATLAAAVMDVKLRIIPNYISLGLILSRLGILVFEFLYTQDAMTYLIGSLVAAFASVVVLAITNKISKGGIGGGDVKLVSCIGFVCGLQEVISTMLLALLSCILVSVVLLLTKKMTSKDHLPFGPFIYVGFVIMSLLAVY